MKFNENRPKGSEIWNGNEILQIHPLTLTLGLGSLFMCSAHRFTERYI